MKTTIDISDTLFEQARAQAKARGVTMRTLVESGLRLALAQGQPTAGRFVLQDFSFGGNGATGELTELSDPALWRESGTGLQATVSGAPPHQPDGPP